MVFTGLDKRVALKEKIQEYLDGRVPLLKLEEYMEPLTESANSPDILNDIFHALQHFDIDVDTLDEGEKNIMMAKMEHIANCLVEENEAALQEAINDFFSRPYG